MAKDMASTIMAQALTSTFKARYIKERLADLSEDITKDKGLLKTLRLEIEEVASNDSKYIRKFNLVTINKYMYDLPEKVVLIMGATGSGKTTLINAIANYVIGVKFEDDKRFVMVKEDLVRSQTQSQTDGITSYTMHHQEGFRLPYTLTLIDTPGYGDTRGREWDKGNTENIKDFFSSKGKPYAIDSISAILFVIQASDVRLGQYQKYTYESILNLFGKDMKSNIFPVFTFSDTEEPKALEAVREIGIPCPIFFQINNSIVFAKRAGGTQIKMQKFVWEMWQEHIEAVLAKISCTNDVSLLLSAEVLEERESLHCQIAGLRDDISKGVAMLTDLKAEEMVRAVKKLDVKDAHRKHYQMVVLTKQTSQNQSGCYTYICTKCERNCHKICKVPFNALGRLCCVVKKGLCKVCTCGTDKHSLLKYHYKFSYDKRVQLLSEAKEHRAGVKEKYGAIYRNLKRISLSYENIQKDICNCVEQICRILGKLNEIALRPHSSSKQDYIDVLIEQEEENSQPGWEERVQQLKDIQKLVEMNKKVSEGTRLAGANLSETRA